jgi:hypothetical protein
MPTYTELLRDPRWQKRRLEIMQRDGFACVECGRKDLTLNVHHRYYISGRDPWDYPDEALVTLSEDCHETITEQIDFIKKFIGALSLPELRRVIAFLRCPRPEPVDLTTDREKLRERLNTADHAEALDIFRQMMSEAGR